MNRLPKASFHYRVGIVDTQRIMLIWDLNIGAMSLTNDIETVVDSISEKESIDPKMYTIIYRDSEGTWGNGWDHGREHFVAIFMADTLKDAIEQELDFSFEDPRPAIQGPEVARRLSRLLNSRDAPDGLDILDETGRRNRVMFSGYQKLIHYLATSADCNRQDIKNIVTDVLDQLA